MVLVLSQEIASLQTQIDNLKTFQMTVQGAKTTGPTLTRPTIQIHFFTGPGGRTEISGQGFKYTNSPQSWVKVLIEHQYLSGDGQTRNYIWLYGSDINGNLVYPGPQDLGGVPLPIRSGDIIKAVATDNTVDLNDTTGLLWSEPITATA